MENFRDQLKVEGINARGYGILPKMVMLDRKLTVEAKAIYSYFCSYAGAGSTAFPGRDKICGDLCIGKDRYYKHRELLIKYGYIEIEQVRTNNKFSHNVYTLVDKPVANTSLEPSPQNKGTDKKQCHQNKDTGNKDIQNKDSIINNPYNINNSLYNQSINQSEETKIKENERKNENIDINTDKEFQNILNNIEIYEFGINASAVEQAIRLLYYADKPLLNNNILVPCKTVQDDLRSLKWEHVDLAIRDLKNASETQQIRNISAYLAKCIYNSMFNSDLKINTEINYNKYNK